MQLELLPKQDKIVVQHNNLINAKFDLIPSELKIFLYLLAQIDPKKDTEFKAHQIPISFISTSTGGRTYKDIKEYAENLTKKTIQIESLSSKNRKKFIGLPLFGRVEYIEGANCVQASFNAEVKDFLLDLKGNFTKAELKHLLNIKNSHSFRIYWLLKQNKIYGQRLINYKKLREILMIGEDTYKEFPNFRRKVLDKALGDLADTDVAFDFKMVKTGKSVTDILFILRDNKKILPPDSSETVSIFETLTPQQKIAYKAMANNGLTKDQADYNIMKIKPDVITKTIHSAQLLFIDKKISNKTAYIVDSFKKLINIEAK